MTIRIALPLPSPPIAPAKLRILETANSLFYREGIRTIGVDRLIEDSSVTKATFYKHFGSKDRLIAAYVEYRHRADAERIAGIVGATSDPEAALRALVADIVETIQSPDFRGCPFLHAAAEFAEPDHAVRVAVREHREWYQAVVADLWRDAGHGLPGDAADEFILARDGAMSGGYAGDSVAAIGALTRTIDRLLAASRS